MSETENKRKLKLPGEGKWDEGSYPMMVANKVYKQLNEMKIFF